ncbi:hypothetical protein JXQ70_09385 [bacterium]|nr:hypothetical protein [bacterium]
MTVMDLMNKIGNYPGYLIAFCIALPLLSLLYGRLVSRERGSLAPHRYVYAVLIYLTSIPGIFAIVVTAYTLFFIESNLLMVNALVYFLPIVSMFITVVLVRKAVELDAVPGFDRLLGLFTLLGITFILVLMVQKTRIWLFFGGSLTSLVVLVVFLFALLKWATYTLFRNRHEPARPAPRFPEI